MVLNKGMTVIETLVTVAILALLVSVVLPKFADFRSQQVLKSVVSDVLSALDKAKSQALNSLDSTEYGIHFQSDKIVLFKGRTYSANDANNENITLSSPATISTITLSGGGSDTYFAMLTGNPNKTGTVVVTVSSLTKTITIGPTGIFSSN